MSKKRAKNEKDKKERDGIKYLKLVLITLGILLGWVLLGMMFISQIEDVTKSKSENPLGPIFATWGQMKEENGWNWSVPASKPASDGFFSWLKNTVIGSFGANKNWIYGPLFNAYKDYTENDGDTSFIAIMIAPIILSVTLILSSLLGFFGTFISAWENRPSFLHIIFWIIFIVLGLITVPITFSIILFLAQLMSGFQSANILYNLFFTSDIVTKILNSLSRFYSYLFILYFLFLTIYSFGYIDKTYGYASFGFLLSIVLFTVVKIIYGS